MDEAKRLSELEQFLDTLYPTRVHELASLLHEDDAKVAYALEYTCNELKQDRHVLVNTILMVHRVIEDQKLQEN